MAARPRKNNVNIPNLYPLFNRKANKVYWRYKHPVTGTFHALGDDEKEAKAIAVEANLRLAEQRSRQVMAISDRIARIKGKEITVNTWLDRYQKIQSERLADGDIKPNTFKQKQKPVALMRHALSQKSLPAVDARDIADILEQYKTSGQHRMAQVIRSVLIDVFKEAQHAGEVPPGYNPALATKQPRRRITRQRLGDISEMKFSDIWDEHLHISQEKTGAKLAIPLSLRCNALNISLREVIAKCRDLYVSKYLIHYTKSTSQSQPGEQVTANTLTTNFKKARNKADIDWGEGTPATFHEMRSLSERLYREQEINTKNLLGHKSQQQTDKYHDDRGKDWIKVVV
ncbi:TPA: tyrosine-type recombinase/integrase [Morganella morganii]|uniref:Tyrosine-type recombinase/integrase n=1 Tax=Morganella morganii TaxID=582 RepID=A0AAN5MDU4_MORMO|nr:tyrosine-type recombinase/integrase [Morganella morganii]